MRACLTAVQKGQRAGQAPFITEDGTSGVYILRSADDQPAAVFKPIDEEPFAPNNPREMKGPFGSETCRPGVKSGESTIREVAAYLLDNQGFSGVPATSLVEMSHENFVNDPLEEKHVASAEHLDIISGMVNFQSEATASESESLISKTGSLQKFVKSAGPIENYAPDRFSADEVHKIAVLDMRICNLDRNACNILVSEDKKSLIPIDHGLTLPDSLEVCTYDLAWLSFPQADEAFSQKTCDFIQQIDIDGDIEMLENTFKFRPECLRNMKITSMLLKRAAARGLTLTQISQIFCRPDEDDTKQSLLENIVQKASLCSALKLRMKANIKDSLLDAPTDTSMVKSNSNNKLTKRGSF